MSFPLYHLYIFSSTLVLICGCRRSKLYLTVAIVYRRRNTVRVFNWTKCVQLSFCTANNRQKLCFNKVIQLHPRRLESYDTSYWTLWPYDNIQGTIMQVLSVCKNWAAKVWSAEVCGLPSTERKKDEDKSCNDPLFTFAIFQFKNLI